MFWICCLTLIVFGFVAGMGGAGIRTGHSVMLGIALIALPSALSKLCIPTLQERAHGLLAGGIAYIIGIAIASIVFYRVNHPRTKPK